MTVSSRKILRKILLEKYYLSDDILDTICEYISHSDIIEKNVYEGFVELPTRIFRQRHRSLSDFSV